MYTLGFTIRKAISVASGVLVPHVGFSFMRQVKNKSRAVVASSQTGSLELQTDDPDENQAVANIDISYVSAGGGLQLFVDSESLLQHDFIERKRFSIGARLEF